MNWYRNLHMAPKIVLPVAVVLILSLGFLTWQIQSKTSAAITSMANRELAALAAQNGNYVKDFLNIAVNQSAALATAFENALQNRVVPSRSTATAMLTGVHNGDESLFAAGMMWEPNAYDGDDASAAGTPGSPGEGRFVPYSVDGQPLGDLFDSLDADFYTVPRKTGRPYLTNPYEYTLNGKKVSMATASYPVAPNGKFMGVVVTDITLGKLSTLINGIKVYKSGYGALVTDDGTLAATPNPALVGKNLFREPGMCPNPAALQKAFEAGQAYSEITRTDKGQVIRYYQPISIRGSGQFWYLTLTVPQAEVMAEATAISRLTLVLSGVTLLILLGVITVLVRSSVRPMNYLAKTAEIIARGNLKQTIDDSNFGGELKTLSQALKEMIASLVQGIEKAEALSAEAKEESRKAAEAMRQAEAASRDAQSKTQRMLAAADRLDQVAGVVSAASTELSAQIEQSDRGATESSSRLSEAATAMNEMNATVLEVAKNAASAADVSASTRKKAEEGARVVEHSVESIQAVQRQSLALKEDMAKLDENARSITQIMGVISDIADQTNLLALNAAIEAARAGDAGRGFAVVADEVRNLAEKTMASTTDVGNAIKAIQDSVKQSMEGVDNAVDLINQATDFASSSGDALKAIVDLVAHTVDQVQAIATASEEQSAASEEINQSIGMVNSVVGQTAQAMGEAARAVADLAAQAQQLTGLIEDMKQD